MKITSNNLYTAVVTPFNDDLSIDFTSLKNLIEIQERNNNGIVIFGSTGESLSLSFSEKEQILDFVLSLKISVPLVVGVPSFNYQDTLDFLRYLDDKDISGVMLTNPLYTKPNYKGQIDWFSSLLSYTKFDAMIYNIPSRSASNIDVRAISALTEFKNFVAIKESSNSLDNMIAYKKSAKNVKIYCGDDYMMPVYAQYGATGLVSVASNAWASSIKEYVSLSLLSKLSVNEAIFYRNACLSLFASTSPIAIKSLLNHQNVIATNKLRLPLSNKDLLGFDKVLDYNLKLESLVKCD